MASRPCSRSHDAFAADGDTPPAIVQSNGEPLAVEVRMQAILWDGAPATMFTLEKCRKRSGMTGPTAPASAVGAAMARRMSFSECSTARPTAS